jgi:hypothetical protein
MGPERPAAATIGATRKDVCRQLLRGMLVHLDPGKTGEAEYAAGVAHVAGKAKQFFGAETPSNYGHEPDSQLILGNGIHRRPSDEIRGLGIRERSAVALLPTAGAADRIPYTDAHELSAASFEPRLSRTPSSASMHRRAFRATDRPVQRRVDALHRQRENCFRGWNGEFMAHLLRRNSWFFGRGHLLNPVKPQRLIHWSAGERKVFEGGSLSFEPGSIHPATFGSS